MANTFGGNEDKSHVTVFNTHTNEKVNNGEYINIADLAKDKYYEGIKNGDLFACTPDSGLNVETGSFFFHHHATLANKTPFFGYPMQNDSFFDKYLNKALDIYTKDLKKFSWKTEKAKDDVYSGLGSIIQKIALSNNEIQKLIFREYKNKEYIREATERTEYRKDMLDFYEEYEPEKIAEDRIKHEKNILVLNKISEILEEIEKNHGIKIEDYLGVDGRTKITRAIASNRNIGQYELRIPVFIGHNEIPQLSWGHAKYAHYTNDKGLNFFEFKHADQLPIKEKS